jgi:hypothetical protein
MLPKESLDIILNLFNHNVTQSYKPNRKQPIT